MRKICLTILFGLSCVYIMAQDSFFDIYQKYYNRYVRALGVNQRLAVQLEPQVIKLANYILLYNGYICEGKYDSAANIKEKVVKLLNIENPDIELCVGGGNGSGGGSASGSSGDVQFNKMGLFYADQDFKYIDSKDSLVAGRALKTRSIYFDTAYVVGLSMYIIGDYLNVSRGIVTPFLQVGSIRIGNQTFSSVTTGTQLATKEYVDNKTFTLPQVITVRRVNTDTLNIGGKILRAATTGVTISTKEYVDALFANLANSITTNTLNVGTINIGGYSLTGATTGGNIASQLYVDNKISVFQKGDTIKSKHIYATDNFFIKDNNDKIFNQNDTIKVAINNAERFKFYGDGVVSNNTTLNTNTTLLTKRGTNNSGYGFTNNNPAIKFSGVDKLVTYNDSVSVIGNLNVRNNITAKGKITIPNWQNNIVNNEDVATKGYVDGIGKFTPTSFAVDYPTMTTDNLPEGEYNFYLKDKTIKGFVNSFNLEYNFISNLLFTYNIVPSLLYDFSLDNKFTYIIDIATNRFYRYLNLDFSSYDIDYYHIEDNYIKNIICSNDGKYVLLEGNYVEYDGNYGYGGFDKKLFYSNVPWKIKASFPYVIAYIPDEVTGYFISISKNNGADFTFNEDIRLINDGSILIKDNYIVYLDEDFYLEKMDISGTYPTVVKSRYYKNSYFVDICDTFLIVAGNDKTTILSFNSFKELFSLQKTYKTTFVTNKYIYIYTTDGYYYKFDRKKYQLTNYFKFTNYNYFFYKSKDNKAIFINTANGYKYAMFYDDFLDLTPYLKFGTNNILRGTGNYSKILQIDISRTNYYILDIYNFGFLLKNINFEDLSFSYISSKFINTDSIVSNSVNANRINYKTGNYLNLYKDTMIIRNYWRILPVYNFTKSGDFGVDYLYYIKLYKGIYEIDVNFIYYDDSGGSIEIQIDANNCLNCNKYIKFDNTFGAFLKIPFSYKFYLNISNVYEIITIKSKTNTGIAYFDYVNILIKRIK